MELIFRKAVFCDAEPIFTFVKNAVDIMISQKIFQWDEIYPTRKDFEQDIKKGEAFLAEINCENHKKIAAVYVLNKESDEAYKTAKWNYCGKNYIVIHRFCVNPEFQNKGIGFKVCLHILEQAKNSGIESVRLDVFTQNPYSLKLYKKLGFKTTGYANWRKGKFFLQEKILSNNF